MHSVRQAASIFYYLGMKSEGASAADLLLDTSTAGGRRDYYDSLAEDDLFHVDAEWAGALPPGVGIPKGSRVSKAQLCALWFGIDPRDGITPLVAGGPSIGEQVQAQKKIARAESNLHVAVIALGKARSALVNKGMSKAEAESDKKVVKAQEAVDRAKEAIKKAKADPGHRQDAHDCTFSAPKGVSIYWARLKADGQKGDAGAARKALALERAMIESVRAVIEGYVEPQLLFTRDRQGGNKEVTYQNVKGIAAALFIHFDARPTKETIVDPSAPGGQRAVEKMPDPAMHVHALLMSMGLDHDDNVKALWTTFLGSHSKAIGAAFRGELAERLRAQGLDLKQDDQEKVLSFDLAGISDEAVGAFSARSAQVELNKADGMDYQEAKLAGRETKGEYGGKEMLADWDRRTAEMGLDAKTIAGATNRQVAFDQAEGKLHALASMGAIDFAPGSQDWNRKLAKEAEKILGKLEGKLPTVDEAVEQLLSMETSFGMTEIAQLSFEASQFCGKALRPGQSAMQWAEEFRTAIMSHHQLQEVYGADRYGRPTFTSRGLVAREKELYYQEIPKLLADRGEGLSGDAVERAIEKFQSSESEKRGILFALKPFQRQMVRDIAMNRSSIHVALAPAGSGKTTSVLGAVLALQANGGATFALAPSNKAAQGLAKDLRMKRSDGMSPQKFLGKIKRGEIELTSKDVIVMDEASMLDFELGAALVKASLAAKDGPAKIVMIGDTEQLPSVGRGNFLRTLAESEQFAADAPEGLRNITRVASSAAHWNRITRQKEDLGKQATAFFALGENAKALEIYERMGALKLAATREEALSNLAHDAFLPMSGAADDFAVAREEREDRFNAFAPKVAPILRRLGRKGGVVDPDALIRAFPEAERALARQWLEDRDVLESCRRELIKICSSTLMIASKNADVEALNKEARSILKSIGVLGGLDGQAKATIPRGRAGSLEICEGERLMFTEAADAGKADFSAEGDTAAKSTVGTVLAVAKNERGEVVLTMEIDGQPGQLVTVNTARFDKFSYAWACTSHAAQGATCSRVFEFASDFAAKQTDYVTKSRYTTSHAIYAADSVYGLFKKRSQEAIEKSDAKDLTFAATMFGLDPDQLDELDRAIEQGRSGTASKAEGLEAARQRSIAQGALVEHGRAPLGRRDGQKESYYATISVGGKEFTLWGAGIEAEISAMGAKAGDHIGLEPLSGKRVDGQTMAWRGYTSSALAKAGLLLDDKGVETRAQALLGARKGATKASRDAVQELVSSAFIAEKEAAALVRATIGRASALSARVAQERGALDELGRMASLPADLQARLAAAAEALPFAKRGGATRMRGLLAGGIRAQPYARPMIARGREWLAVDGELAFCATEWGAVEAWSAKSLPAGSIAEARAVGGSIDKLLSRRKEALAKAKAAGIEPVSRALHAVAPKLDIKLVEHPEHGMCVGVSAKVAGTHESDPELLKLFTGKGGFGVDASMKKGGLGGLGLSKKWDSAAQAWIFPIKVDELGFPSASQPAIAEIVALGAEQGHSTASQSDWQEKRELAWDAIEASLNSPWGMAYAQASAAMGIKVDSPKVLASRTLGAKAADIVAWDARVLGGSDDTREWEFCATTGADGADLGDDRRILSGVSLHADGERIYILRGQRVLAIERAALGADGEAGDWVGRKLTIEFARGAAPTLLANESDDVIEKGRSIEARIAAGDVADLAKMKPDLAQAYARVAGSGPPTTRGQAFALAWARREATQWSRLEAARAAGMSAGPGAKALERYEGKLMQIKGATVLEVGEAGVLIEHNSERWLVDRDSAREAFARDLRPGRKLPAIKLARDGFGRASLDAAATHKAARGASAHA